MFDKPCFTYCPEPYYVNFAFNVIISNNSLYSLKYLLGITNSSIGTFWFNVNSKKRGVNNDVGVAVMRNFPVHRIDFSNSHDKSRHDEMVQLVDTMLGLHKKLVEAKVPDMKRMVQRQIEAVDNQIDRLVYELYGLTDDEIGIVENE